MHDGTFVLNFLGLGTQTTPDLDLYRDYFLEFAPEKWIADVAGGSFRFNAANGIVYTCLIVYRVDLGICVMFQRKDGRALQTMATVGDLSRMNEIVDVGSDELYPVGAFVSPQEAWPLVEQFLRNPTQFPSDDLLKNSAEVEWPNPY